MVIKKVLKRRGSTYITIKKAKIKNLIIKGNIIKYGSDQNDSYNESNKGAKLVNAALLATALGQCKALIWAHAAYSIPFCVCRDVYHLENNTSNFERMLAEAGIVIPTGTINNAMCRSPWLKYHIDRWEENGVMKRVLKLRDEFRNQMDILGVSVKSRSSKIKV